MIPGPSPVTLSYMTIRSFDPDAALELLDDPVAQWLDWEQQANLIGFRASTEPVEVEVVDVPRDETEVYVLPGAPAEILDRFLRGERVSFPRHPLNRDTSVQWFAEPVRERWQARFTSSRTLALPGAESGRALFSLKMSTDRPHPDFHQPEKTKLREEAVAAVLWVSRIAAIDALLGPIRNLLLVREVLVVMAKGGETGFMVRDLRAFQDGYYYLPALSLPFVGRQIARRCGEPFGDFWGRWYAAAAGRAKARLLARYGLWYETPNPQNLLVRLDRDLRSTDCLVFRDIGDGECATDAFECDPSVPWTKLVTDIRPETANSFWAFDEAGDHAVPAEDLERWRALHDDAFYRELADWFPGVAPAAARSSAEKLDHWNAALRSEAGIDEVARSFAARIERAAQA